MCKIANHPYVIFIRQLKIYVYNYFKYKNVSIQNISVYLITKYLLSIRNDLLIETITNKDNNQYIQWRVKDWEALSCSLRALSCPGACSESGKSAEHEELQLSTLTGKEHKG